MKIFKLKNTITEIKVSVYRLNSKKEKTEERIRKLEDRTVKITQSKKQKIN